MHMIVGKGLPGIALRTVMQLDWPGGAGNGIGKAPSRAHVIDGEMIAACNPSCLANARKPVAAHAGGAECFRKLAAQKTKDAIGLGLARERIPGSSERLERGLHMSEVHERDAAAGQGESKPVGAHETILTRRRAGARRYIQPGQRRL